MTYQHKHFVAFFDASREAIQGMGSTEEEALAEPVSQGADVDALAVYPATVRLARAVELHGGCDVRWTIRHGVADLAEGVWQVDDGSDSPETYCWTEGEAEAAARQYDETRGDGETTDVVEVKRIPDRAWTELLRIQA